MDSGFREQVRRATNIVEIVGERVGLRSGRGGVHKGLCPFHREKTPSFQVDEDRQRYHCFGCGAGGDAFQFLQELEGVPFVEALHGLARRAGIPIPQRNPQAEARREAVRKAIRAASDYYGGALRAPGGKRARDYLDKRGIAAGDFGEYGFGFAPRSGLAATLRARGSPLEALLEAGLVAESRESNGQYYPFFRNRLMIPIHDSSGLVVGFAGRSLDGGEPKYVNSPDSPIYHKKSVLYGMHRARRAMRAERSAVLLEGYFDCVAAWRAGIPQAVAVCGTAFTDEQAALLKACAREVVVCFDADASGQKAAVKSLRILLARELRVRVVSLGDGLDPDDFVRARGAAAFRRAIAEAPDFVRFLTARPEGGEGLDRAGRFREVLEILAFWPSALEREAWLEEAARATGFSAGAAKEEMARILARRPAPAKPSPPGPGGGPDENPWEGLEPVEEEAPAPTPARRRPALTVGERDFVRWTSERPGEVAALLRRTDARDLEGFASSGILIAMKRAADAGAGTATDLLGDPEARSPGEERLLRAVRSETVPLNTSQQRPADCLRALLIESVERARREAGADLVRAQALNRRLDRLRRRKDP